MLDSGWEGRIMFTFSMIGYKNSRKVDYAYGPEVKDTTDLGTIRLQPTALMLQEVEVKAKVPRITMRGDTIVCTTASRSWHATRATTMAMRTMCSTYR